MNENNPPENHGGNRQVWSLADLSRSLKNLIENNFERVSVRAEIGRVTRAASGHVYFDLKDANAVLSAVCWKGTAAGLTTQPEEGAEVIATGKLTAYQGQSRYQMVVADLELAGEGALLKQLEERRRRLEAEGLFSQTRKKPVPALPRVIGVVTSPTGSVIRDILHRLGERFPVRVLVWPVLVQGAGAAEQIATAIRGFDALMDAPRDDIPLPDTVIVARGGGSAEDLMAFNEENVVRAVAACRIPIISSIGHETDTPLADHAADLRAPTPTAAAEYATPLVAHTLRERINDFENRLLARLGNKLDSASDKIRDLARAIADPAMLIESKAQRLDIAMQKLPDPAILIETKTQRLDLVMQKIIDPTMLIESKSQRFDTVMEKLESMMESSIAFNLSRLKTAERLLEASSFERTLERGFAVVRGTGDIMTSATHNPHGGDVELQFADGKRSAVLKK